MIQLILKPKTELVAGEKYGLFYADYTKKIKPVKQWDSELQKKIPIEWEITNSMVKDVPLWKQEPTITSKFYKENGCGPDEMIYFDFATVDNRDIELKAVVRNMQTGRVITCYISQGNGKFQLGHNMCYGECNFGDEEEYEVIFYLLDESGNLSKASKAIKFTKPVTEGWSN